MILEDEAVGAVYLIADDTDGLVETKDLVTLDEEDVDEVSLDSVIPDDVLGLVDEEAGTGECIVVVDDD